MDITKDMQVKVLEYLKPYYRQAVPWTFEEDMALIAGSPDNAFQVLRFLIEEGLVDGEVRPWTLGFSYRNISITSAGVKSVSMEDIGAETVITAKLHQESLALLAALVKKDGGASPSQKNALLSALQKMPEAALSEIVKQIVAQGIQHLLGVVPLK